MMRGIKELGAFFVLWLITNKKSEIANDFHMQKKVGLILFRNLLMQDILTIIFKTQNLDLNGGLAISHLINSMLKKFCRVKLILNYK